MKMRRMVASQDRRHLVVILSGFRPANSPYDFAASSAAQLGCDVLWIQDDFDGGPAYYLRSGGHRGPERAVQGAISAELDRLDLSPERLTIAGFSEGGSAALYHGLTIGAANVLATVPQMHVGSYVRDRWPQVHTRMTTLGRDDTAALDRVLPEVLAQSASSSTRVYVLSSERDPWHGREIVPHLDALENLGHFTLLMSSWPRIQEHIDVTPQNRHLIIALLTMLSQGLSPSFDRTHYGELPESAVVLERQWEAWETVVDLDRIRVQGDRMFPEGVGFVRGRAASGYGQVKRSLLLSGASSHEFDLGTVLDGELSTRFFKESACDYSAGRFASLGFGGLRLGSLPIGTYEAELVIQEHGARVVTPLRASQPVVTIATDGDRAVRLNVGRNGAFVDILPLLAERPVKYDLRLESFEVADGQLDVRGWFAAAGMPAREWGDIEYYLVLRRTDGHTVSWRLGLLNRPRADVTCGDAADFVKAYFAPLGDQRVDVSGLESGDYEAHVTVANQVQARTVRLGEVTVSSEGVTSAVTGTGGITTPARVAIIGSCVTRDNFSSRIAPEWRQWASLVAEHYQSSLLSVFGDPVPVPGEAFADLETHDRTVVKREFARAFLPEVRRGSPDVVVVDLFTDARFGVIDLPEGPVTDNSWKLTKSRDAGQYAGFAHSGMGPTPESHLQRIEEAARQLAAELQKQSSGTLLVLHSARAAARWRDIAGLHVFPAAAIQEFNDTWEALDEAFLRGAPDAAVIPALPGAIADADHPWGRYWVHYDPAYYRHFAEHLESLLGIRREVRVTATPEAVATTTSAQEAS